MKCAIKLVSGRWALSSSAWKAKNFLKHPRTSSLNGVNFLPFLLERDCCTSSLVRRMHFLHWYMFIALSSSGLFCMSIPRQCTFFEDNIAYFAGLLMMSQSIIFLSPTFAVGKDPPVFETSLHLNSCISITHLLGVYMIGVGFLCAISPSEAAQENSSV